MSITVVLINYNNADYLAKAIDSVVGQSLLPDELIVCDDCSTDGSIGIVESFMREYSFIRLHRNLTRLGAAGNRDTAVRMARSRFVMNLDSDDWLEKDVVWRTLQVLRENPRSFVISNFHVVRADGSLIQDIQTVRFCAASRSERLHLLGKRDISMPGNQFACARELYLEIGGLEWSLGLYEDWDFYIRATSVGVNWVHTGMFGFSYRRTGSGLSATSQRKHMYYRLRVIGRGLLSSRMSISFAWGVSMLFAVKGMKYLRGGASPHGYN